MGFEDFTRDLRFSLRQLRRSPAFTVVALLALALGVGSVATVFTIVNAVLVRALPFERAHELYRVTRMSSGGTEQWLSVPEFTRWQRESHTGVRLAGFTSMDFNLRGLHPEGLSVVWASESFLPVLGISPRLGRFFTARDFEPGADRTALLSHEMWQRRYAGDPAIVGSHVDLEGPSFLSDSNGRYTIIGVLPARFWLFYTRTDFVIPMRASARQLNDPRSQLVHHVVARFTGSDSELLRSDLAVISDRLARESSQTERQPASIAVTTLRTWHFGDLQRPLLFLMGTALLVALTACANVSLLLIARASYRRREFAIRSAIGAGRRRLVRQIVTESLLLALIGGVAGVCLAAGAVRVIAVIIPSDVVGRLPGGLDALSSDVQVGTVAITAILMSGLLSGLGSLLAAGVTGRIHQLRDGALGTPPAPRPTFQAALVVVQMTVAVVLLIAGGLLFRSLLRINNVDLGIQPREGLVVWLNMNLSRYPQEEDRSRFYRAVLEQLRGQPEVRHASGIDLPFNLEWQTTRFRTEANQAEELRRWPQALVRAATPTYFERHGIRLVQGRSFTEFDDARSSPVAIISQDLADRYWPGRSAVGQLLTTQSASKPSTPSTVVGVVTDIRSAPHAAPQAIIYRPLQQGPPPWLYITVEGDTKQPGLLPAIRRAVWAVDPDQPLDGPSGPWTLHEWLSERTDRPRLIAAIANGLAAIALALATVGLYGVLSYTVARRTSEFGLRIALGASPGQVAGLVLRRTLALTALGVAIGLAAAAFITPLLQSMLFGVTPLDRATFAAAAAVFVAASTVATLIPVRRALTVSPSVALRTE